MSSCSAEQKKTTQGLSSSQPANISIENTPVNFEYTDADTPTGLESQTSSQWKPQRFHLSYPHAPESPNFNTAFDESVQEIKDNFQEKHSRTSNESSGHTPEMTVSWFSLLNRDRTLGLRLVITESNEINHSTTSQTFFKTSSDKMIRGKDIIDESFQNSLLEEITAAAHNQGIPQEQVNLDQTSMLQDVSFTSTGALQVELPKGKLAKNQTQNELVTIAEPEKYLSAVGKEIRTKSFSAQAPDGNIKGDTNSDQSLDCHRQKCIALTFDDGPGLYTNQILDTLEQHHAKATFFTLGRNVVEDPNTVKRAHDMGMAVGDHTWNHLMLSKASDAVAETEISRTASAIWDATGAPPFAVRPPYGDFSKSTPHADLPFVVWDIDSEDWKNKNAQITTNRILTAAHPGGIVLMHDIHPSTAQALPGVVEKLQEQGYTLVTVPELLGNQLNSEGVYFSGNS